MRTLPRPRILATLASLAIASTVASTVVLTPIATGATKTTVKSTKTSNAPATGNLGAPLPVPTQTLTTVAAFKDRNWKAGIKVYRDTQGTELTTLRNGVASKGLVVFTVTEKQGDWLKVRLPMRPNGVQGYVNTSDVDTFTHDFSMIIELKNRRIMVFQGDKLVHIERVAIGKTAQPTPTGRFYTVDLLRPKGGPNGVYGAYAYGLSGFSNVIFDFGAGGDGRLGIHGTNQPSLLGQAISSGCIRMSNAGITKLRNVLPLGVPVDIVA